MSKSSLIVTGARLLIGKPFRHMGRGPTHYDCAGVVKQAYAHAGIELKDIRHYGREPYRDGLRQTMQDNFGDPVTGQAQAGDVLLMRFVAEPHHLAIVANHRDGFGLSMIHAYGELGRVVEHGIDRAWSDRVLGVYRWHG